MSTTARNSVRFRHHPGRATAGLIVTVSLLTLVAVSPWFALLMLPPLAWTVWAWRASTEVNPAGLRVRALLGSVHVPWSRVLGLSTSPDGRVAANLAGGTVLPLTAVAKTDLPALAAASGHEYRHD